MGGRGVLFSVRVWREKTFRQCDGILCYGSECYSVFSDLFEITDVERRVGDARMHPFEVLCTNWWYVLLR